MPASPSTCQLSQELIFKLTTIFSTFQTPKCFISNTFAFSPKRKYILLKTQVRFTSNALAFETKRTCVFRALLESSPEALLRPYFFVSSFFASSSFFTGAERISR